MRTLFGMTVLLILAGAPALAFEAFEIDQNIVVNYGKESRILKLPESAKGSSSYYLTLYPSERGLFSESGDQKDMDVGMLIAKANEAFHQNQMSEAIDNLGRAEQLDPSNVQVKNMFGSVYYKMGDFARARRYWEDSLKLDEKQPLVERYLKKLPATEAPSNK